MFQKVIGFLHKVDIALLAFIKTMPPGVVRSHHGRPHAGPPAFMVPQLVEFVIERLREILLGVHQVFGIEFVQFFLHRFEVNIVIIHDHFVQLDEVVIHPGRPMALEADVLHFVALHLPVGGRRKRLELRGANGERGLKLPG